MPFAYVAAVLLEPTPNDGVAAEDAADPKPPKAGAAAELELKLNPVLCKPSQSKQDSQIH